MYIPYFERVYKEEEIEVSHLAIYRLHVAWGSSHCLVGIFSVFKSFIIM